MKQTRLLSEISRLSEYTRLYSIHLSPWICHNGIGPTTVSNNFVTVRDIGYSEKKYGDICQFMRDTCLFTSRNIVSCYPPPPTPSKQASTIHGYFVSATTYTVIRLLLIHSLINVLPICLFSVVGSCFVHVVMYTSVPSLILQTSWRGRWRWLLYLVVLPLSKLWSVALSNVTVGWSAL